MTRTRFLMGGGLGVSISLTFLVMSCFSDPRKDDPDVPVPECSTDKLSNDPAKPESSLRNYLLAAADLKTQSAAVEAALRDACNAVDTDLGLTTGTDSLSACKPINDRVLKLRQQGVQAGGQPSPGHPGWAEVRTAPNCTTPPHALEDCVATCAAGCDPNSCSPPTAKAGKCAGNCTGVCVTSGANVKCGGLCKGEVTYPEPSTCEGHCAGVCTGAAWIGSCAGACGSGEFVGHCDGTCTGKCNSRAINVDETPADAGTGDAGKDAAPPPAGPPLPKTNAPGNCTGLCEGVCSNGGNGFCNNMPCLDFSKTPPDPPGLAGFDGDCFGGLCAGKCTAALGTGAPGTCTGECTENAKGTPCDGVCIGTCDGQETDVSCTGALTCPQQNAECANACAAMAALKTVCSDATQIEVYAISDKPLADAFANHAAAFGKAISQLASLRTALSYIGNRAYGDFVTIGLKGSLIKKCVAVGNADVTAASNSISTVLAADPTTRKATN